MRSKRRRFVAIPPFTALHPPPAFFPFVLAIVMFVITPLSATAAEIRSDDSPRVRSGETVTDDLYIFGGQVEIDGTVTGDVMAAAGQIDVDGVIEGSLNAAAGSVEIQGEVGGAVRVTGGEIVISGEVGGDVVALGGSVQIESDATVDGDVVMAGGDLEVLGAVGGEIRGNVETLTIDARVGGDVDLTADDVLLRDDAQIAGDLSYASRDEADIADGAGVTGSTDRSEPSRFLPGDNAAVWLGSAVFRLLCALIAGLVVVLLMPRAAAAVADTVRDTPVGSFLLGLALLIALPIALILSLVTIVGIPVAIIGFSVYVAALYLSQVFVGMGLGRILLPRSWDDGGRGFNLLAMTIGVIILAGLRLIPVPFLGWAIAVLTAIFGLGALVIGLRRRGRGLSSPSYAGS